MTSPPSLRRHLRTAATATTGAALLALLVFEGSDTGYPPTTVAGVLSGALCLLALRAGRPARTDQPLPEPWRRLAAAVRPARLAARLTVVPQTALLWGAAAFSLLLTAVTTQLAHRPEHTFGVVECGALLLLVCQAFRRRGLLAAFAVSTGPSLAVLVQPLRLPPDQYLHLNLIVSGLAVCLAFALLTGLSLRLRDALKAREREAVRQAQRLQYARDLHDFVAHHVTAIVAQTKAARYVAAAGHVQDPVELDRMLAGIEDAGSKALTSMRSMVTDLREPATAPTGPAPDLGELLAGAVADLPAAAPPVTLSVDPLLTGGGRTAPGGGLPSPLVQAAHRVVQEALTNVRRHAPAATGVAVTAHVADHRPDVLAVTVTDNAGPADPKAAAAVPSGGFGLLGLTETVEAVGGRLTAGPVPPDADPGPASGPRAAPGTHAGPAAGGWRVRAELPLPPGWDRRRRRG